MKYGIFSHYIYIALFLLLGIGIIGYVIKKECFESSQSQESISQKYTITEISKSVDALLNSLNDKHSLVKVHSVQKSGPSIMFNCMLYNHARPSVKNFYAKVRIPLSSKSKYTLEESKISDSSEHIENGVHKISDSQIYGSLKV